MFFFISNGNAQDKKIPTFTTSLVIEKLENVGLEGATAKLFEQGTLDSTITTKMDGIVNFNLKMNSNYTIEISKSGYISKIISINTKIPKYENQSFVVGFPVGLFVPCEGLDWSVLKNPVVKIVYNDLRRDFLADKNYGDLMGPKVEDLMDRNEKCKDDIYNKQVKKADNLLSVKKYTEARENYVIAKNMRPDDNYVQKKIAEIDKLLADQQANEKLYNDYITQADKQFNDKNYALAKEIYKRALTIKSGAPYPTSQIAAIDKILAQKNQQDQDKQAQEAKLQALVDKGDNAMNDDVCGKAVQSYTDALNMKPNDNTIQKKLNDAKAKCRDIQAKAAQDKDKQQKYNRAIAKADSLNKLSNFEAAKSAYFDAQTIDPTNVYPAQKIKEINDKINAKDKELAAKNKEKDAAFSNLVDQGDDALNNDVCGKAVQSYTDALKMKPNDNTVQKKLNDAKAKCRDIQAKSAQEKDKQQKYNRVIAKADSLNKLSNYAAASSAYSDAQQIDPSSDYPSQKIKEIDNLLKAKDKEKDQQYKKALADGDKAFDNEDLPTAKTNYQKALSLKPYDQKVKEKISTIDKIIAEQQQAEAEKKNNQAQYNQAIADADAKLKKNDFDAAEAAYQKALQISPDESYPKQKLNEIEDDKKAVSDKNDKDFALKIQSGDRNFAMKNYAQAKQDYQAALIIKPGENYPTQRVNDISKIIADQEKQAADQKAADDAYKAAIAKADNLYNNKQYDKAIIAYNQASTYKPDEQYPFTKKDEINKLKKQQELDANYKKSITEADSYFNQKNFEQAKTSYSNALNFNPNDTYATSQISKADKEISDRLKKLADSKSKQDAYDKSIADADKAYNTNDYATAKTNYQTAMAIFPDKPYAKQRIDAIDKIQKDQKNDEDYKAMLDDANDLYSKKMYDQAIAKYKSAALIKPGETFPNEKIKEINTVIAKNDADKQKQIQDEKNYNDAIAQANNLYDKAQYDAAKKIYEQASAIMPNENYPKQRISKINEIKNSLAKLDKTQATQQKTVSKPASNDESKITNLNFKNNTEKEQFLKELLAKYPAGVTCEVYTEKYKTTTRYIVIRENQATDYREVHYSWGGYDYFKNDKPITQLYFKSQVQAREGESYTKTDM
jgi:tetratricopeptide (TPR) repeat protein